MDYYDGQDLENISEQMWKSFALAQFQRFQKPLAKTWGVAQAILDIDADVYMFTEVGGKDSLDNFNHYFLQGRYNSYFVEGNSSRNIDLGFLVKKGLPFRTEARSNRDTPVEVVTYQTRYMTKFSRDIAELRLYEKERLSLIILLTHLKSQISTDQDLKGRNVRTAEAIALASFYNELRRQFPEVPIILGGDFNSNLSSVELEALKQTDLIDFHDIIQTSLENRVSLLHFDVSDKAYPQVLDYILVSPHLKDRVIKSSSYTYRYKSFFNIEDEIPTSLQQRYNLPSDHYPLVLTVYLPESSGV